MEKKKRHNATVTFSRKEQKEEMLQHLNSVQLQNLMPEEVREKDCLKVLWAVEYLHRLAVDGKIRVQVPMYEEDSQEKQGLLDEIAQLNGIIRQLQADNKELSDLEGGYIDNINSLIKENESLRTRLARLRQSLEWTAIQVANTPEYAEELFSNLLTEIASRSDG